MFFFTPLRCNFHLYGDPRVQKHSTTITSRWLEGKVEIHDHKLMSEIQSNKGLTIGAFTLNWLRERSATNLDFHLPAKGWIFSKIWSFLAFQMFHVKHAKISKNQGPLKTVSAYLSLSSNDLRTSQLKSIISQQATANWHSKNIWSLVLISLAVQRVQICPPSTCQFFLAIRSLVSSLS